MADSHDRKRSRDEAGETDLEIDSPEVKRLRENLLETLEDDESEFCTATQDLDLFMKSFEEEIAASPSAAVETAPEAEDGESRPDLGYLLEASDDELGLPPTASSDGGFESELGSDLVRVDSESAELGSELWEILDYDSFGLFGFGSGATETASNGGDGEYVALDGLFDYSDMGFGLGGVGPRPETLPA